MFIYHPGKQAELFNYKDQGWEFELEKSLSWELELKFELVNTLGWEFEFQLENAFRKLELIFLCTVHAQTNHFFFLSSKELNKFSLDSNSLNRLNSNLISIKNRPSSQPWKDETRRKLRVFLLCYVVLLAVMKALTPVLV